MRARRTLTTKVNNNGAVSISWQSIVATLALGLTLAAAGWTLFQTQFTAQDRIMSDNKASHERMLTNLRRDTESYDSALRAELLFLRNALITQRNEVVTQPEFKQFFQSIQDRLDRVDKQLQLLESTRPTTGELQSTAKSLDSQVNRVEERLRLMEDFVRGRAREIGKQ